MKKLVGLIIFIATLSLISCGSGGGGGGGGSSSGGGSGSSTPSPPLAGTFGSVMTAAPESAPGAVGAVVKEESTEEFWTKERIEEAMRNPMPMPKSDMECIKTPSDEAAPQIPPGVPERFPPYNPNADKESRLMKEINLESGRTQVSEATSSCSNAPYRLYPTRGYDYYPEMTMGVLVLLKDNAPFSCSAALINRRMILTAAHCVSSNARWHTRFMFVPGANNGSNPTPYGVSPALKVLVYSGWFYNRFYPADYSIIVLRDAMGDQLGSLGFTVNQPVVGLTWDQYGYPGPPVGDGYTLLMSRAAAYYLGSEGSGYRIWTGTGFAEGASGGPWVLWAGNTPYANSVVSTGGIQCPNEGTGPYFDDRAGDLYRAALSLQ